MTDREKQIAVVAQTILNIHHRWKDVDLTGISSFTKFLAGELPEAYSYRM